MVKPDHAALGTELEIKILGKMLKAAGSGDKVVDALYLRVLSRHPTAEETKRAKAYVAAAKDQNKGCADLFWALLNSGEFLFIH